MLGALGLMWLGRGQNGNGKSLLSLLNADVSSSGMYGGGSSQVLTPPVIGPEATTAVLSGNTTFTALAVAADTGIPAAASKLTPPAPEIVGTLSALFAVQGPTISEISGNAVRQVGLLADTESILHTPNEPSVAIVNITTPSGTPPVMLEEDEPIEVLPTAPGAPKVITITGNDETTVVTTGINLWTESYFTTPGTIVAAIDQGYFSPPKAYVPRTWQQIETDWDIAQGLPSRHEPESVDPPATVVVVPEPVGYATGLDWI